MIWALLALYLFGASGEAGLIAEFERAKTFIAQDVRDKERRAELLTVVEAAEKATKDEAKARGKTVNEIADVSGRHNASTADIQTALDRYRTEAGAYQERMISLRFYLKAKMTREEWARMFPAEKPAPAS